jgi:hypothetical protein
VAAEERLQKEFISEDRDGGGGDGMVQWKMGRVKEYAEAMQSFRSKLLVLMHISGGQPARGTEVVIV